MGNFGDIPTLVKNVQKSAMLFINTYMRYLRATEAVTCHKNSLEQGCTNSRSQVARTTNPASMEKMAKLMGFNFPPPPIFQAPTT
jgi:hypothetical protein